MLMSSIDLFFPTVTACCRIYYMWTMVDIWDDQHVRQISLEGFAVDIFDL